jgi:hypothetical protein
VGLWEPTNPCITFVNFFLRERNLAVDLWQV